jgi:hypothetical protein
MRCEPDQTAALEAQDSSRGSQKTLVAASAMADKEVVAHPS